MLKKLSALFGIIIFFVGFYIVLYLARNNFINQPELIVARPTHDPFGGDIVDDPFGENIDDHFGENIVGDPGGDVVIITANDCKLSEINLGSYTMSDTESQAIQIQFVNTTGINCSKTIEIYAPNFDIFPTESKQTINLQSDQDSATITWMLTPRKIGDYEITFSVSDGTNLVLGMRVTNFLGFSVFSVQLLSWIGTILGPMLSIPWWYEKFTAKKAQKNKIPKRKG